MTKLSNAVRTTTYRKFDVGAETMQGGGVSFRVWAPKRKQVTVVFEDGPQPVVLQPESDGYFSAVVHEATAPMRYRFQLDDDPNLYPDPASRFQPDGPEGPSQIIDPTFDWTDDDWPGVQSLNQVTYEMHIGTFTPEGTFAAAMEKLPELADLGITMLEVMPVADFSGSFGWGYDGVNLFAPTRLYGRPDNFRRFVDRAHSLGMAVILDVVYNHLGPCGNYLPQFSDHYFTQKHSTDWGEAINFDGEGSRPVRDYYISNAAYWVSEFHLDGLRLDATQDIHDDSDPHILTEIGLAVRKAGGNRGTYIVAETESQIAKIARPEEAGGYGLSAVWNDDFHHSASVVLTARKEAYYTDYFGKPQEFISAAKYGFLYQNQRYFWQGKRRGQPSFDLAPECFVNCLQNHDQVANSSSGLRCHMLASPGTYRAMTGLLLLGPWSVLLFQGQEFASSSPFFFFADHEPELAKLVFKGRRGFLEQFPSVKLPEVGELIPNPAEKNTFDRSKLHWEEWESHNWAVQLHRDLLSIRREDPVISGKARTGCDGAVLNDHAFVLRFFSEDGDDRLLVVNFGHDALQRSTPEPLLAPPLGTRWDVIWSSENPKYNGHGAIPPETDEGWHLTGQCSMLLAPVAEQREGTAHVG